MRHLRGILTMLIIASLMACSSDDDSNGTTDPDDEEDHVKTLSLTDGLISQGVLLEDIGFFDITLTDKEISVDDDNNLDGAEANVNGIAFSLNTPPEDYKPSERTYEFDKDEEVMTVSEVMVVENFDVEKETGTTYEIISGSVEIEQNEAPYKLNFAFVYEDGDGEEITVKGDFEGDLHQDFYQNKMIYDGEKRDLENGAIIPQTSEDNTVFWLELIDSDFLIDGDDVDIADKPFDLSLLIMKNAGNPNEPEKGLYSFDDNEDLP